MRVPFLIVIAVLFLGLGPNVAEAGFWSRKVRLEANASVGALVKLHLERAGQRGNWKVTSIQPQRVKGKVGAWRVEARGTAGQIRKLDLQATVFPEQQRRQTARPLSGASSLAALADAVLKADTGQGADAWVVGSKLQSKRVGSWKLRAGSSPKTWPFRGERTITLEIGPARR